MNNQQVFYSKFLEDLSTMSMQEMVSNPQDMQFNEYSDHSYNFKDIFHLWPESSHLNHTCYNFPPTKICNASNFFLPTLQQIDKKASEIKNSYKLNPEAKEFVPKDIGNPFLNRYFPYSSYNNNLNTMHNNFNSNGSGKISAISLTPIAASNQLLIQNNSHSSTKFPDIPKLLHSCSVSLQLSPTLHEIEKIHSAQNKVEKCKSSSDKVGKISELFLNQKEQAMVNISTANKVCAFSITNFENNDINSTDPHFNLTDRHINLPHPHINLNIVGADKLNMNKPNNEMFNQVDNGSSSPINIINPISSLNVCDFSDKDYLPEFTSTPNDLSTVLNFEPCKSVFCDSDGLFYKSYNQCDSDENFSQSGSSGQCDSAESSIVFAEISASSKKDFSHSTSSDQCDSAENSIVFEETSASSKKDFSHSASSDQCDSAENSIVFEEISASSEENFSYSTSSESDNSNHSSSKIAQESCNFTLVDDSEDDSIEDYDCAIFNLELDDCSFSINDCGIDFQGLMLSSLIPSYSQSKAENTPKTNNLSQSSLNESVLSANSKWNSEINCNCKKRTTGKVRFSDDCLIYEADEWERASKWEEYARDRLRFQDRILELEKVISPVLNVEHRNKVLIRLKEA